MIPPRRQASKKADAVNKQIAQQTLVGSNEDAEFELDDEGMQMADSMSVDSSPLSLRSRTPKPGSGLDTGLGLVIRQELAEKSRPTLVQQVAKLKESGLNVGEMIKFGKALEKGDGQTGGNKQMGGILTTKDNGTTSRNKQMDETLKSTKLQKQPLNTTPRKQKTSKAREGLLPSSSPLHGALGALKRPMSAYLENSPDNGQREREHKRPAQRRWEAPQPSGRIRMPLNNLVAFPPHFQERNPKVLDDADNMMTLYGMIHKHCDLSHLRALEIRDTDDYEYMQVPGFPGLPAYDQFVGAAEEPHNDGLSANERRVQVFNTRTQTGIQLTEDEEEECRLRSTLVTILGNQRLNFEKMRQMPKHTESFNLQVHFEVDLSILALTKLKPATKKKGDPPLFANGTWYSSKRMEDEYSLGCTFCMFDCDYGISDERVWLPMEASGGFCAECHLTTQTSIDEWNLSTSASPDEFTFDCEKHARINDLCGKAANPPLKELGDDVGFKMQAMQMKQQNSNPRRQIELGSLGRIPNAQLSQHQVMSTSNGVEGQASLGNRGGVLDAQKCQQQVMSAFNGTSGDHISPFLPRNATMTGLATQQQQQAVSKSAGTGVTSQTSMIRTGKPTAQQQVVKNAADQTSKKGKPASTVQKQQKALTTMTGQLSMTGACVSTAQQQQQPAANIAGNSSIKGIGVTPVQNQAVVSGPSSKRSDTRTDVTQAMATLVGNLSQDKQDFMKQHLNNSAQGQIQRRPSNSIPSFPALSLQNIDNAKRTSIPQQMGAVVDGHPRRTSSTGLPQQSPTVEREVNNHRRLSDGIMPSSPAISPELTRNGYGASGVQHMGATARSHQRRLSYTGLPPPNPQTRVNFMGVGAAGDVMNHHRRTSSGTMSMPSTPMIANANGFPKVHHRRISSVSMPLSSPQMATENVFPNAQQNAGSGPSSSPPMPFMPDGGMPRNNYQSHHRRTSSSSMVLSSPAMMLPSHSPTMENGNGFPITPQNGHQVTGPGSSPPMQSIMETGMPGNYYPDHHRRTSSGSMSLTSPTMRVTANRFRNYQQHGSVSNGPGGSAVIHPLMADFQMPLNLNQQRRLSNGNMMASSPIMMAYGSEAANIQQGQAETSSSGNPLMQSPTLNGALPVNNAQQRRLSNSTTRRDVPPMMPTGNGMPNGQKSRAMNRRGDPGRSTDAPGFRNHVGNPSMESAVANYSNLRHPSNRANLPVQVIQLSRSGGVIGPTTLPPVQTISNNATEEAAEAPREAKKVSAPRNPPDPRFIRSFDGASDSPPKQNDATKHQCGSNPASANDFVNELGITNGLRMTKGARFGPPLRKSTASQMLPKQANEQRPVNTARVFPTPSMSPEAHSSTSMPKKPIGPFVPPSIPPGFATAGHITGPVVLPSHSPASTVSDYSMSPFPPFQDPMSMTPNLAMSPLIPGYEAHAHPHAPTLRHAGSSPLPNIGIMGPPPLPAALRRSVSQPAPPQFQPVTFCRGCPWRQIDVKKARICEPCKAQKLEIIKHKHVYFSSLHEKRGLDGEGDDIGWSTFFDTQRKTCMVCPALAEGQCRDCSLRLCSGCQVMMKQMGKNDITNLIQQYGLSRAHLRNDAFLFRGDGLGY